MKFYWSLLFFASALLLFFCAYTTLKRKTRISLSLRLAMLLSAVAATANGIIVATSSYHVALVCYTVCSLCILWTMLFFLEFCVLYTAGKLHSKRLHTFALIVLAVDSISYIANIFLQHAFIVLEVASEDGCLYFTRTPLLFGMIHLGICYALLAIALAVIVTYMLKMPSIYWAKYLLAIAFSLLALVLHLVFLSAHSDISFTTLGFTAASPFFTYFALFYRPRLIIDRMLARVVNKSDDLVFFFGVNNDCIYINEKAQNFFDIPRDKIHIGFAVLSSWFTGITFSLGDEPCTFICTRVWKGQLTNLKVMYDKLFERNRVIGSYFHIHDITSDVNRAEVQEFKATHDELTGLYNRSYLFQKIHHALLKNLDKEYYIIVTDIKDFKMINDTFGRHVGDAVLINSARSIRTYFKSSAIYGRINQDRFAILITEEQLPDLQKIFVKNQELLSDESISSNYPILIHGGIYPVKNRGKPVANMIDHALIAIDSIKESREVRLAYYTDEMRKQLMWEQRITSELDAAIKNGEFEIYLQPQADNTGVVRGAEVLIRWNHPEKGFLTPTDFVPVFEKSGQITKLDAFVWEEACRLLQKWKAAGFDDYYLSVNISPKDFYYIDVHEAFCALVEKYEIDPAHLKLEITETVMITDLDQKIELIDKLHQSGFAVEMDDFGSGYSSLNMLKSIPVDVLKIDMAFLYHAKDIQRSRIIIQQVVVLSKELGIPVITEGVETEEQMLFLREIGCDMFQGYYFARPLQVTAFEEKYMSQQESA